MTGEIFHMLNRGVDKRDVFWEDHERVRFVHGMNDFNRLEQNDLSYYNRKKYHSDIRCPNESSDEEDKLVNILAWTLLSNHVHLLVEEIKDDVVGKFSRKNFGGYTKFFNEKYDRSGVLFQGKTKIKRVESESHFLYLPFYIHLNIIDVFQPNWRDVGIKKP